MKEAKPAEEQEVGTDNRPVSLGVLMREPWIAALVAARGAL
jgi:hypothetical protein